MKFIVTITAERVLRHPSYSIDDFLTALMSLEMAPIIEAARVAQAEYPRFVNLVDSVALQFERTLHLTDVNLASVYSRSEVRKACQAIADAGFSVTSIEPICCD